MESRKIPKGKVGVVSDLQTAFEKAAVEAKALTKMPSNNKLLKLYALYKQGSSGDVAGERPSSMDFVNAAKYDAWKEIAGTPRDDAMQGYIDLVGKLKG
ncbi:MAG: acyl-CoA-binding protein [Acidobacteria bacterium]|uniref:Acyl-CoA-binding protein n=1 Tax=Candidatus Polarisedimenticola svalbardensis TaxID=2886004 RepID=A0A8J6Y5M7_9BACT|nr:acyl-CoA-binding protein [Candidatus Polarisedimenticola svalbardensis]